MIQIELWWWNVNVEKQMRGRFYRQGQDKEVKVYRLKSNAVVDRIISENQVNKGLYNDTMMGTIVCDDSQEVVIPPVFESRELDEEETELYRLHQQLSAHSSPSLPRREDRSLPRLSGIG
ncbi:hypothetical protein VC83_00173 [Pseudogymnoascus destructans]|uniref:Uncharacterized protein n=2 Tax=Pseudogymnoascus destructans TaxID=655981 RepID=L8FX83_PSED2|nr:uncharacterized protein VC83_00173 [Pseudogymnoascus destructans]ELR05088.1 hypothetical protein GMDG_07130 [Pseudogymnoascus destructans 20631-21]OAF63346.1 hypothetical protein VC83_00173 [Pseudogymnoascus destructans]